MGVCKLRKLPEAGFTLLEVLIAMVILAIALTAVIKSTTENIRDNAYLQEKTAANWAGMLVVNQIRAGLLVVSGGSQSTGQIQQLGTTWHYQANVKTTPNPKIKEIDVDITRANTAITLTSYLYAP